MMTHRKPANILGDTQVERESGSCLTCICSMRRGREKLLELLREMCERDTGVGAC